MTKIFNQFTTLFIFLIIFSCSKSEIDPVVIFKGTYTMPIEGGKEKSISIDTIGSKMNIIFSPTSKKQLNKMSRADIINYVGKDNAENIEIAVIAENNYYIVAKYKENSDTEGGESLYAMVGKGGSKPLFKKEEK